MARISSPARRSRFGVRSSLTPPPRGRLLSLLETLAHEAAHSLLFGIQISGPLVLNPDDARFASPLRVDLRPMDGVYHATFVSARMHFAMQELLASGLLKGEADRPRP